jgi:cation:H+ antiporter
MTLLWAVALILGIVVAAAASRRAVRAALVASAASGLPTALVGLTVVAVGTDLPEIANSISAAVAGQGDVNVGNATGSATTQVTLVLALLCLAVPSLRVDRRTVVAVGLGTTVALVVDAWFVSDGLLSRPEGAVLVMAWIAAMVLMVRSRSSAPGGAPEPNDQGALVAERDRRIATTSGTIAVAWLVVVAAAASIVVESFVRLTDALGVPALVASAIVLALGTSLPELIVDLTAVRSGAVALAVGELFGSSLVDSSLALGIGPAIRSTAVSSAATTACLIAAGGVLAAMMIAASRRVHHSSSAVPLVAVYVVATALLVATVS